MLEELQAHARDISKDISCSNIEPFLIIPFAEQFRDPHIERGVECTVRSDLSEGWVEERKMEEGREPLWQQIVEQETLMYLLPSLCRRTKERIRARSSRHVADRCAIRSWHGLGHKGSAQGRLHVPESVWSWQVFSPTLPFESPTDKIVRFQTLWHPNFESICKLSAAVRT